MKGILRPAATALVAVVMGLLLYVGAQVMRPPREAPFAYLRDLHRGAVPSDQRVVVLVGDSLTRGRVSADYVGELQRRLSAQHFRLVNAGVNGELAFHTLQRAGRIASLRPDVLIVLIGTEDAFATLDAASRRRAARRLHLPQLPSAQWFEANLEALVERLRAATAARIVLMSIPPIGEELDGPGMAQARRYTAIIQAVAARQDAGYLPLFERMQAFLRQHRGNPPHYHGQHAYLMYRALLERFLLGRSFAAIARGNGFQLVTDFLHITERGAGMAAELAADYLRQLPPRTRGASGAHAPSYPRERM